MTRYWVGVASADHVRRGRAEGFMQLCHGRAAPLRRIQPGDGIVYYSPSTAFRGSDKLQSFTAIGLVRAGEPYPFQMTADFCPSRRDVDWWDGEEARIAPLLEDLAFSAGRRNWGYQLRFGVFEITAGDFERIAEAMGVRRLVKAAG